MKKTWLNTLTVLLAISLFLTIFIGNAKYLGLNMDFHKKEFTKHNISQKVNTYFSSEHLEYIATDIITYMNDNRDQLSILINEQDIINQKEKIHLSEIKNMVKITLWTLNIAIVILIITFILLIKNREYKKISYAFIGSGIFTTIWIFFLKLTLSKNFVEYFDWFHRNCFSQLEHLNMLSWDKLGAIFPPPLFSDLLTKISTNTITLSIVLIAIGIILINYKHSDH